MDNHTPLSPQNASRETSPAAFCGDLFHIDPNIEWQMDTAEQMTLLAFAQRLRPQCVIEIGSRFGGSMQVFSRYAQRVISCDIDPTCQERFGYRYQNAEFVTGPSQETLPPLLARLEQEQVQVSMLLIDGEHSADGVQGDIHALMNYRPACNLYVLMHDCFNPAARRGIRTARWSDSPYVHAVEVDFVPGVLHHKSEFYRQLWGGFALAVLSPARRSGPLTISAKYDGMYRALYRTSFHWPLNPRGLSQRVAMKLRRLIRKGT